MKVKVRCRECRAVFEIFFEEDEYCPSCGGVVLDEVKENGGDTWIDEDWFTEWL